MKIICFLFDPNVGGPTIRSRQISGVLRNENIEVQFALPGTDGTALHYLEEAGFVVHDLKISKPVLPNKPLKFLKFVLKVPVSLARLVGFLRRENPDVVHINGAFDILPAIAAKLAGTPVVWQLNDMLFGTRLSSILGRFVGTISDVVAISSSPVAQHYNIRRYTPTVLPVPVDTARYTVKSFPLDGSVCVGLVGNWNPLKRQGDFIAVLNQLKCDGFDVTGRMYGKLLDSQKSYWSPLLREIESLDLGDIVTVEGFVSDIPNALQSVDILLVTSQSEAGPLSCIEAMASGIPVVSYAVGDVQKMLDPNGAAPAGIVTPVADLDSLIDACRTLLHDRTKGQEMGRNGRERAKKLYDLACVAPQTAKAYRLAAKNGRTEK